MKRVLILVLSGSVVAGLAGCEEKAAAPTKPAATKPAASAPSSSDMEALRDFAQNKPNRRAGSQPAGGANAGLPANHPPIGKTAPPDTSGPAVKFDAPPEWKSTPPKSNMRKAQYVLPRAAGDAADGELVIFYFGKGEGGGVMDNLDRWKAQMTAADGKPLPDSAVVRDQFEAGGMKVHLIDIAGTYAAGAMVPGQPAAAPVANYRMIAAVIESPNGPWFVKATGPVETISQQREAIRAFIASAKQ